MVSSVSVLLIVAFISFRDFKPFSVSVFYFIFVEYALFSFLLLCSLIEMKLRLLQVLPSHRIPIFQYLYGNVISRLRCLLNLLIIDSIP